jgi:hypothetical protein
VSLCVGKGSTGVGMVVAHPRYVSLVRLLYCNELCCIVLCVDGMRC